MKSIGLFGDSFAGTNYSFAGMQYHWSTLLKNHYDCELVNHGSVGSSVYYSYKKFLQNHAKHDCIIFLVTEPGRYIKPVITEKMGEISIPNLLSIEHVDKTAGIVDPRINDLRGWFLASDDNFNDDMSELMIDKVLSLRPDSIVIPCFNNSCKNLNLGFSLVELQNLQANFYNVTSYELLSHYTENCDIISGHLLPEINQIVYENIANRIESKKWDWTVTNPTTKYKLDEAYRRNK